MDAPVPPRPKRINGRGMKAKGDAYERELAAYINTSTGLKTAHRAPLSGGGRIGLAGGTDLLGCPKLFIEAKRCESLNFRKALAQVEGNARKTGSPDAAILVTRRSREPTGQSLVVLTLDAFLFFYVHYLKATGVKLG